MRTKKIRSTRKPTEPDGFRTEVFRDPPFGWRYRSPIFSIFFFLPLLIIIIVVLLRN